MTVELIGIIAGLTALFGLLQTPSFLVSVFCYATLLGSAAAIILESLGGTNISPAHLLLGFMTLKLLSDRRIASKAVESLVPGRPGFWLLLTVLYSIFSAYYMPRLFAGQTFIFPVRFALSPAALLLEPNTANLTQTIYLIGDFICFFVLCGYQSDTARLRAMGNIALTIVFLNLVFVVLDLVTFATGTAEFLSFIRNANYSVIVADEVAGFKRVIGSFIEASSFGSATLTYFAFSLSLWLDGVRPGLTLGLASLSLVALIFSTSTTSYVGLGIFLMISYLTVAIRAMHRSASPQMMSFLVGAPVAFLVLAFALPLNETLYLYLSNLADTMVFNKLSTSSGVERSAWNAQAVQVFFDTYGFGAGNGSLRASSFPLAVLGCLGIIGTTLYTLFFITLFAQRDPPGLNISDRAFRKASRSACLALLITLAISGALTDPGLQFFIFASIACSRPSWRYEETPLAKPASDQQVRAVAAT